MKNTFIKIYFIFSEICMLLFYIFIIFLLIYIVLTNNAAFDVVKINFNTIIITIFNIIIPYILFKYINFAKNRNILDRKSIFGLQNATIMLSLLFLLITLCNIFPNFFKLLNNI